MQSFLQLYLAWAGPNVMAALVAGTIVWWLHQWRRTGNIWPGNASSMIMATGGGVLAVVVLSLAAALFGLTPVTSGGMLGVIAGVVSATLIRERA